MFGKWKELFQHHLLWWTCLNTHCDGFLILMTRRRLLMTRRRHHCLYQLSFEFQYSLCVYKDCWSAQGQLCNWHRIKWQLTSKIVLAHFHSFCSRTSCDRHVHHHKWVNRLNLDVDKLLCNSRFNLYSHCDVQYQWGRIANQHYLGVLELIEMIVSYAEDT